MSIRITQEAGTEKSAPYIELSIDDYDGEGGMSEITIRKYPRRVFVAYSCDNGLYGGDDNMDVFIAPSYITERTPHNDFDLLKALMRVCASKSMYGDFGDEVAEDIFLKCKTAWDFVMLGDIEKAKSSLPKEEVESY